MWIVPIDVIFTDVLHRTDYALFDTAEEATQFVRDMQKFYPSFEVYAPVHAIDAKGVIERARILT